MVSFQFSSVASVVSDSVRPYRRQHTRLPRPWDSPGKNTGVGCHCLLHCVKVKVKSLSRVRLVATPWTAAYQAPPSMEFSRQEYWSGLPLPSPTTLFTRPNCWTALVLIYFFVLLNSTCLFNFHFYQQDLDTTLTFPHNALELIFLPEVPTQIL